MSDKRKYKKDSYTEKKRKALNREKQTQMPVNVSVKAVGCFCRGAPSLMFDRTLKQNHEIKFWTDPTFYSLEGEFIHC